MRVIIVYIFGLFFCNEIISAEGDNPMKTSKTLYFSPSARLQASEGAVDGRNRLGPAVNNGQIMKSVYWQLK